MKFRGIGSKKLSDFLRSNGNNEVMVNPHVIAERKCYEPDYEAMRLLLSRKAEDVSDNS